MRKKILITGASGFIGIKLLKRILSYGDEIYAVVRNLNNISELKDYKNLHVIELEMKNYKFLPDYINDELDVFYHLAWEGYGISTNDPIIQYANVLYSIDAFKAAEKLKTKKFIFTGTSHEYLKKNIDGRSELCSIYGSAKLSFKQVANILAQNSSMLFNSTIFSHIYGDCDYSKRSSYHIMKSLLNNQLPKLANANMLYDWTYVEDAVSGLIAVSESEFNYKDYYIGGKLRRFCDIVEDVKNVISPEMKLVFGQYIDDTYIDYDMIDLLALYRDTKFEITTDFKSSVLTTSNWIKNNNI